MKKTAMLAAGLCAALLTAVCSISASAVEDDEVKTITVLPYRRQKITGWGCFSANYYGGTMNRAKTANTDTQVITRKAAMSTLFNDMGVTILRGEIVSECGNGDASLNTDWMDKTVEAIKAGQDAGIKDYMITSWTPPYEMMMGEKGAYRFNPEYEDLFCQFIVNAFNYITSHGCTAPVAYSFQNEPQTGNNWCRITYGQYQRIAKKMRKALDEGGYKDVRLMVPETAAWMQQTIIMGKNFCSLYEDPEFERAAGILGSHAYFMTGQSGPDDAYNFTMHASNFPDKERWETEYSSGRIDALDDINMDLGTALRTTEIMLGDVIWNGCNCWMYWNGYESRQFTYPDHKTRFMETSALGSHQSILYGNGFTGVKKNEIGVALGTIWKNVPPGSIVHWSWTDDDTLFNSMNLRGDLGAFEREDGTYVLVIVNKYDKDTVYNINGLAGSSAKVYTLDVDTDQVPWLSYRNVTDGSIREFMSKAFTISIIVTDNEDLAPTLITVTPDKSEDITDDVFTTPNAKTVIKGYVDEPVSELTVNGKSIDVAEDLSFSFEIDAVAEKKLDFRCRDVKGMTTSRTVDIVHDDGFINLRVEKYPESVNTKNYTFHVNTGALTDLYLDGKKINTEKQGEFDIPVELAEGDNTFKIEAVSSTSRISDTINIFCDSIKPVLTIDDKERTTNDWEYQITGSVSEPLGSLAVGGGAVEVKPDMRFSCKVILEEGENEILAEAVDPYGNKTEEKITVTYTKDDLTPHFVDGKMYARKTERNINIDGNLNEESWRIDHKICKQVVGAYPANNICNFGLLWDEKYLYIGAKVQDTEYYCLLDKAYNNDSIEFLINPSASRAGTFEPADKQLFSGPINNNRYTYFQNKKAPNILQMYNIHDGGYEVEITVPWTEIEKVPEIGGIFAFELANNDDDNPASQRTAIMTWSSEDTEYYAFTTNYGLVELVGADDIRYEDGVYEVKEATVVGEETIEVDGITYTELSAVCSKYGSMYYDNPMTGVLNVCTSHARKIDIKEGANQTFRDNELITWKNPVIKHDNFYYIDEECEKEIFKGIEPFRKYKD